MKNWVAEGIASDINDFRAQWYICAYKKSKSKTLKSYYFCVLWQGVKLIIADKPKISTNNPFVKDSMNAKKSFDMHYKELVPALILDVPMLLLVKSLPLTEES